MKHNSKSVILIALISIINLSCFASEKLLHLEFETDYYEYNVIGRVDGLDPEDVWDGTDGTLHQYGCLTLPKKINGNDITLLRQELLKIGQVGIDKFGNFYPIMYENARITNLNPQKANPSFQYINDLNIDYLNGKIIVWEDYYYLYSGGAHGLGGHVYLNYSVLLNKILTLSDILKPGFEKKLNKLIQTDLKNNHEEELFNPEAIGEIVYPDNFRITPDGLEFIYAPYDIAPYSSGEIRVPIYIYELTENDLLNPGAMVRFFPPM